MSATGSLETIRLAELLQVASIFKKMGSLRLLFPSDRAITVYVQNGDLSGLTDTGRVWQLGDLFVSLGRITQVDKQRLLTECTTRGKRLGQLMVEQGYVEKSEMEGVLRRLIMQSLLYAVENERSGTFELHLGAVSQTTMMFPITDFLIELTSAVDELDRLRGILGPGGNELYVSAEGDEAHILHDLPYRVVQVLAHVDGEKTPMNVAATAPLSPTETLRILCDLATAGVIDWTNRAQHGSLGRVVPLRPAARAQAGGASDPVSPPVAPGKPGASPGQSHRTPGGVW
jgi:hypothetical protein